MNKILSSLFIFLIWISLLTYGSTNIFKKIPNKVISSFGINRYYANVQTVSLINCISICATNTDCVLVSYQSKTCKLYKILQIQYFIDSLENILFKKKDNRFESLAIGLQNYWPIISHTNDIIGGAHMYGPVSAGTITDRFNNPNSAIHLNGGYYVLPNGVFFSGELTVTIWVYVLSVSGWLRVFDFGNNNAGIQSDVLSFYLTYDNTLNPGFVTWPPTNNLKSSITINISQWYHVAFMFKGTTASVYINGVLADQRTQSVPVNVMRTSNYVGKSLWSDPYANAIYDELRIYNRALDVTEIIDIMSL